jgi:tetratricopeptide (TPR) repeat protein
LSLLVEKIPFFLVSLVLVLTTLMAQDTAIGSMVEFPLMARIVNAVHSTVFYLQKFLIPISLSPHYSYFQIEGSESVFKVLLIFLIFLSITLAAIFGWRRQKQAWLIAWVFYLLTLSPVLGLIQVGIQGAADRYVYFPTVPVYLLMAGGVFLMLRRGGTISRSLLFVIAMAVFSVLVIQTRSQIRVWQSEASLWTHVIKLDANNEFAHSNRGIVYKNNADYENAALEFEAAGEGSLTPHTTLAWRAVTYMHLGRNKEAIEYLVKFGTKAESKSELKADSNCIQYNIGWNFAHLGMYEEATELFELVDVESPIGPDAGLWLDELSKINSQDNKAVLSKDLPDSCKNLIPSERQTQGVR